jgi:regulator of PEP synthase PpsR (kinase-PPPase family)
LRLTTNAERLVQVRRNRLLSLKQAADTSYVDPEAVQHEVVRARRMFADQGWPIVDVSRRSIEEAAAAIISLYQEHIAGILPGGTEPAL